jgi:DsbC/DsbD-like thiol-disulfide interchange protein/cytochrome c biogenesis protein CcdA
MARLLLFLIALLAPALAQARTNAITPELVVSAPAKPGEAAELAIVMHVQKGWHGYWLNPGDAGLPMSVDWEMPKGWSVGELRYPVPTKLLVAGIVNYVYESDYAILSHLTVPAGATGTQLIAADMRWLACTDKVCVPEQGRVEVAIPAKGAATDPRFDGWRQKLAQPIGTPAHYVYLGGKLLVAVPLPKSVDVPQPYIFPISKGLVDYAAPQHFRRNGDWVIAELAPRDPPKGTVDGVLTLGNGRGLQFHAVANRVPEGGTPIGETIETALWWAILGALIGGLLLNLMPCVFPILAMKALHLAKAGGDERAARHDALGYALGAVAGTAALGVALLLLRAGGSAAGWAFQLQDPRTIMILVLLAAAITLNLLRAFELPVLAGEHNPAGSFGTGALAAFVATPCSGPFMGAALGAALLMPWWGAVAVFAALGLGIAMPFIAVGFVPALRRRLPRPGPWMGRLQRILAIPMAATVAAGLWLLDRQGGDAALIAALCALAALTLVLALVGWRQRGGKLAWPIAIVGIIGAGLIGIALLPPPSERVARLPDGAEQWSEQAVAAARATGKPVFVYFTADWCLTCKANEAGAIDRDSTRDALERAGVKVLVGDWTNGDPAIGRFLESQGRAGVPLYLWYAPGKAEPEILPQVLTPAMLIARAGSPR